LLLYVVYMCQKSLNFTYAFKCYQQNVSGFTLAGPPCIKQSDLFIPFFVLFCFGGKDSRVLVTRFRRYLEHEKFTPFQN